MESGFFSVFQEMRQYATLWCQGFSVTFLTVNRVLLKPAVPNELVSAKKQTT
jgi:hypothetical protein